MSVLKATDVTGVLRCKVAICGKHIGLTLECELGEHRSRISPMLAGMCDRGIGVWQVIFGQHVHFQGPEVPQDLQHG